MKKRFQPFMLSVAAAWLLSLNAALYAAEPTPPPDPPADSAASTAEKSDLRRLDQPTPAADAAVEAPDADDAPAAPEATEQPESPKPSKHVHRPHGGKSNEHIAFAGNSTLAAGEAADSVVSIFGSSTSAGEVSDAVISIFGNSQVTGGSVGDTAVSVFGNTRVNGHVHGQVVSVLGNVELGPDAIVDGQVVCVGGQVTRHPSAIVHGDVQNVAIMGGLMNFDWLHSWFEHCLLFGRPLAFAPGLNWAWTIAVTLLALYVLLGAMAPGGITKCGETLEQRPWRSILAAVLVTLLAPIATIILLITIVGAPALVLFLIGAGLFGKAVMLAWIGRRIMALFRGAAEPPLHPAVTVLVGGALVLLLYTVPVLGFVLAKLLSWIGLGVVVYTLILAMKRSKNVGIPLVPPTSATPASIPVPPAMPSASSSGVASASPVTQASPGFGAANPFVAPTSPAAAEASAGFTAPETAAAGAPPPVAVPVPPSFTPPVSAPPLISAMTLPRAGFWIRILASLLDAILIGVVVGLLPRVLRPDYLLLFGAYCAVMWSLKGTTVGGIVCSLKVVRLDDRPVDWTTGVVRALGGFLSLIVAGIGFIWVAFDDQKQSWHDKIAGTTIVLVPKGVSLV